MRPILIGSFLCRFIFRLLFRGSVSKPLLCNDLEPSKLTAGTNNGCEQIVHSIGLFLNSYSSENLFLLRFVAWKAFNIVEHQFFIGLCAPSLCQFVNYLYRIKPTLSLVDLLTRSIMSTQQGENLSKICLPWLRNNASKISLRNFPRCIFVLQRWSNL